MWWLQIHFEIIYDPNGLIYNELILHSKYIDDIIYLCITNNRAGYGGVFRNSVSGFSGYI